MDILSSALYSLRKCFRKFFPYNTDAAIELVDSLSCNSSCQTPIELTNSLLYTRHYSTLSYAISSYYKPRVQTQTDAKDARSKINKEIENTLCQHLSFDANTNAESEFHLFAIDVTPYQRPYSPKLEDKGFVHVNETISGKKPIAIGHHYSCVAYLTKKKHWAPPISIKRVSTSENEFVFGVKQWTDIINDKKNEFQSKKAVGCFDAGYSNPRSIYTFVESMKDKGHTAIFISRLRGTRVLMRPNKKTPTGKPGRAHWFDNNNPFKLKNEDTWGDCSKEDNIEWITKKGKKNTVKVQVWSDLRMRSHNDCSISQVSLTVVRISVSNKDGKAIYKNPLWLVMVGEWPTNWPITFFWKFYTSRFDIEHFFKFAKQRLLMTKFQTPDTINEENWMQFSMIAYHQLYHARTLAKNIPRPWEKKEQNVLTDNDCRNSEKGKVVLPPARVQRDMPNLLKQLPKIKDDLKVRGIPEGRKEGDKVKARPTFPVIKKSPDKPPKKAQVRIILGFETNGKRTKVSIKYDGVEKSDIEADVLNHISQIEKINPVAIPPPI